MLILKLIKNVYYVLLDMFSKCMWWYTAMSLLPSSKKTIETKAKIFHSKLTTCKDGPVKVQKQGRNEKKNKKTAIQLKNGGK